jgi:hypothetical protein
MALQRKHFDQSLARFLQPADNASIHGYCAAFLAVTVIATTGAVVTGIIAGRPPVPAGSGNPGAVRHSE